MAKKTMTLEEYQKLEREAGLIQELMQHPRWKLFAKDLKTQMKAIERLLTRNKLRTYELTVGDKRVVTTKDDQVAENAGMYKMGEWVFAWTKTVTGAPGKAVEFEHKGLITIQGKEGEEHG